VFLRKLFSVFQVPAQPLPSIVDLFGIEPVGAIEGREEFFLSNGNDVEGGEGGGGHTDVVVVALQEENILCDVSGEIDSIEILYHFAYSGCIHPFSPDEESWPSFGSFES